jgi:hypothetical protein
VTVKRPLTTWRQQLEIARDDDDTDPVIAYAPDETAFDTIFDPGYGGSDGPPVLAWTAQYVYFPVVYDGAEWLGRAPRNPQPQGQPHVGGE